MTTADCQGTARDVAPWSANPNPYGNSPSSQHFCYTGVTAVDVAMPKSGIAGFEEGSFPNFLRNHHIDFQCDCTSLHSHKKGGVLPLPPPPLQYKMSSVFFILAILTGIRWNLRVLLIWISLIVKDVVHFLKCLSAILDFLLGVLYLGLYHIFYWIICSFDDQLFEFFCIFWRSSFCLMWSWWWCFPIL